VGKTLPKDGNAQLAAMLRKSLDHRITERKRKYKALFIKPQEIKSPQVKSILNLFLEMREPVLAEQLTYVDFHIYSQIDVSELLCLCWNDLKLQHRSPNVIQMMRRCDKLSFWVSTLILSQPTPRMRKKVYEKFLAISLELTRLNSFHTLMGVIAGVNRAGVGRLKAAKSETSKYVKPFREVEELMSPKSNYSAYRQRLHSETPPCLPYLGVYLIDLTFTEEGNKDEIEGLINFSKRELISGIIEEIKQYQQQSYAFIPKEPMHTFLLQLPAMIDNELFSLSLNRIYLSLACMHRRIELFSVWFSFIMVSKMCSLLLLCAMRVMSYFGMFFLVFVISKLNMSSGVYT